MATSTAPLLDSKHFNVSSDEEPDEQQHLVHGHATSTASRDDDRQPPPYSSSPAVDDAALDEVVRRALLFHMVQTLSARPTGNTGGLPPNSPPGAPPPYDYYPAAPSSPRRSWRTTHVEGHPQNARSEVWRVTGYRGTVRQPEQNRIVVSGTAQRLSGNGPAYAVDYVYADELPCRKKVVLALVFITAVFGSPLALLCTLPALLLVHQVSLPVQLFVHTQVNKSQSPFPILPSPPLPSFLCPSLHLYYLIV